MNRIRLLPEHVANQIAAGEVVERPASVVKELVENALDAGSTRIHVEIAAGGRSLIRVTDDGSGMGKDDALLCLERHATSKIRRAEDLAEITTMGFRGEAIPSIASVSRFTLTTREAGDTSGEGTQIIIQGGRIAEVKAAGTAPGTSVEVRQLFFNLPARRKFLRAEETERAHIQHYLMLAALAHPAVAFSFVSDGRPVWQLPPAKWQTPAERFPALRERLRPFLGADVPLLPVDFQAEVEERGGGEEEPDAPLALRDAARFTRFRLWGFIGAPGVSRSSRDEQHLFVNQRPVENRGLNFALLEGYHTTLMKGRYPVCCLFLELDPAAVDVNIHPQKREVKFREEAAVRRLVARAVREALLAWAQPSGAGTPVAPGAVAPPAGLAPAPASEQVALPLPHPAPRIAGPTPGPATGGTTRAASATPPPAGTPTSAAPSAPSAPTASPLTLELSPTRADDPVPAPSPAPVPAPVTPSGAAGGPGVPLLQVPLRLVGVIGRLYVLLESDRGLVLMDQHAAHERILYEQMLARLERAEAAPSQRLLLPETIEFTARDAEFVRRNLEILSRLGVGLGEFGERTFLLDALPPFVRARDPRQFAVDLVDELKSAGQGVNNLRLGEHMIAKTVCRHAVKANDALSLRELQELVDDLRRCAMPYTCPHGRPTLIEMSWRELERKFGRTQ